MQYDGSININTRVDTKGMNKGTKSIAAGMGNVLKSIKAVGAALGLAFSGAAVFNFVKKTLESFDLMSSGMGGKIKELKDSFEGLKGALANTVLTLFAALQPYIIAAVTWLTQMLNTLTAIITALFGVQNITANAADNTEDMKKSAKGALASFDQINVLGGGDKQSKSVLPNVTIPADMLAKVEDFKKKMLDFLAPVIGAWERLKDALEPLGKTIWAGLQWAWENILVPLGTWVITDALPAFMDLLAGAADVLNEALIALAPLWKEFFDNFLQPLAEWAGGKIIEFLDWLTEKLHDLAAWIKENPEKFREFAEILGALAAIVFLLAASYQTALLLTSLLSVASLVLSGAFWAAAGAAIAVAWPIIALTLLIAALGVAIYLLITQWDELATTVKQLAFIIGYYISQAVETVKQKFENMWEAIKSFFKTVGDWFAENVTAPIRNAFAGMLFNIFSGFITTFGAIRDYVSNVIGEIVNIISGALDGIFGAFADLANINIDVSTPGTKSSNSIAPRIPRLATGAVIPPNAQFAAILGDQRSGMNIESPVSLMRQTFDESLQKALSNQSLTVQTPVYLDGEKIFDSVKKVEIRRGTSLVSGGIV